MDPDGPAEHTGTRYDGDMHDVPEDGGTSVGPEAAGSEEHALTRVLQEVSAGRADVALAAR